MKKVLFGIGFVALTTLATATFADTTAQTADQPAAATAPADVNTATADPQPATSSDVTTPDTQDASAE